MGTETMTNIENLAANTIRLIAADGVQKANSGHPGMPMGMADCAYVLWTKFMKFNPEKPDWPNRDRFVLSAGHGSMLLYTMLYLTGYDVKLEDLQSFRQWGSRTPGHPEVGCLPGVETTTGPLGQGFGNGVGMAIAAKMTAARFDTKNEKVLGDNYVYAIVSDGDLMEGVSHEAASIAGHLKLGNIIYLYDNNSITIEGKTELTFSEDIAKRFEGYGWHTVSIDGHNHDQIKAAIEEGQKEKERPTIIIAKTHIGFGSPNKHDTAGVHGSPLGADELKLVKKNFGFPEDKDFYVPEEVKQLFADRIKEVKAQYKEWETKYSVWRKNNPELAKTYDEFMEKKIPDNLEDELLKNLPKDPNATRSLSSAVIQQLAELVPNLVGGSADLSPSTNTIMKAFDSIATGKFAGRNFHFGIREHAMGSIMNGLSLYGGFIPFGATFLVFSDYMRPPIRLAAISDIQAIYVFTHDSIFVGEDGPTHEPIEQVPVLRAIPNMTVIRPCDSYETAMGWAMALRLNKAPVALILTRQKIDLINHASDFDPKAILKGGYVIAKEKGAKVDLTIVASGSEVPVAIAAKEILEKNLSVRVVSMPSVEIYNKQPDEYKNKTVPAGAPVVVVEATNTFGWGDVFRQPLLRLGMERFGASAPYKKLAEEFGFTGASVAEKVSKWINTTK